MYERQERWLPAAEAYLAAVRMGGSGGRDALSRLAALEPAKAQGAVRGRIHLLRAQAARHLGETSVAVAAAEAALDAAAELAAEVCSELNQIALALPADGSVRVARARCHLATQSLESAARDLTDALRLDPATAGAAAPVARELLKRRPGTKEAALVLAEACRLEGNPAEAAQVLDDALESNESRDDLDLILARRRVATDAGDAAGSERLLARALEAAPDRNAFLASLHRDALRSSASVRDIGGSPMQERELRAALLEGDSDRPA